MEGDFKNYCAVGGESLSGEGTLPPGGQGGKNEDSIFDELARAQTKAEEERSVKVR